MNFCTEHLTITPEERADLPAIAAVYNSNPGFLREHLGCESVSEGWTDREYQAMENSGFVCHKIVDRRTLGIVGFADARMDGEECYLSLLMIHGEARGQGIGREVLEGLAAYLGERRCRRMRIDVVTGYDPAVLTFWQANGFAISEEIRLKWNGRELPAYRMGKDLIRNID